MTMASTSTARTMGTRRKESRVMGTRRRFTRGLMVSKRSGGGTTSGGSSGGLTTTLRARKSPSETAPEGYQRFDVERTLSLGIVDARTAVGDGRGREATSARAWTREPSNFIAVVFGVADAREREEVGERGGRMFDVTVRPRELFGWEITPEFVIEAIPEDSAGRVDGRARLVGTELKFAGDPERLPPGFRTMGVWANIDARIDVDEAASTEEVTVVRTEVRVRIAAEIPRLLRALPGFSSAGVMAIAKSIDIVGGGINEATQATYDAWASARGATPRSKN